MKYKVEKRFEWDGEITEKMAAVMRMFGVNVRRLREQGVSHSCEVEINEGDIVYLTGPSGSGKSVLLRELEKCVPAEERVNLSDVELSGDKSLIDCMAGSPCDILSGLKLLSVAGLNDVFCVLNRPCCLSEGQKYRFRLAMALAAGKKFIFADEFCTNLDRITAAVIAYNIHKFAKRRGVTFVLASSHEDILGDLRPDVVIVKELAGEARVVYKKLNTDYPNR